MTATDQPRSNRVAHYQILHQIGRGGQATVYLAEDTRLHRQVALKVMDPGFTADRIVVERFRREAEITSKLDHPRICTVYDSGEERGVLWIAMRYVEGDSLATKIAMAKADQASVQTTSFVLVPEREGRDDDALPAPGTDSSTGPKTWGEIARVLALFEDAARTLHVAHEHGVIHRDIKPGNVIITNDGDPVIVDFGLAQEVGSDQPTLTNTGDIAGTPAYMSPEQIVAYRIKLDRRTDVYSLAVSLFECLTLRRPFEAPTRQGVYQAILAKEPPDLRSLNPAIPTDLCVVVATALEKDRDRRYHTALDLAEELRRVRGHEPILAKPVGPLVRLQRWAQRNPGLAVAIAGVFAVLVAGLSVALVLLSQRDRALHEKEKALEDVTTERSAKQTALSELDRGVARAHATLADLHLERWREALAADDREALQRSRALVEEHDLERRHAAELAGIGHVKITVLGEPATVDLFHYVEEAEVAHGGSRRLVPAVPVDPVPVGPGTWALRVVSAGSGVLVDDVVFELDGQPVGGRCHVAAGLAPLEVGDALLFVDDDPVDDPGVAHFRILEREKRPHVLRVLRGKTPMTFHVPDLRALGLSLHTPEQVAAIGGIPARIWRAGRVVEATLPRRPKDLNAAHAEFRTTATPLFLSAGAPVAGLERELDPGSWLLVAHAPGRVTQPVTFVVPRGGQVAISVELPARAGLPDFVHVPPGYATIEVRSHGGDSRLERRSVGGFWILDREISVSEYLEFMNSPECPESRKATGARPDEMHGPALGNVWNRLRRSEGGELTAPEPLPSCPMNGVSGEDAEAFVAWLNSSARAAGSATTFTLPTDVELLRAACGDDARPFPYGRHFGPVWQKTAGSRPYIFLQPSRGFPVDESPFGAFDLLGSQTEWCIPTTRVIGGYFASFGASFQAPSPTRLQAFSQFKRDARSSDFGFRLVVRDP